MLGYDVDSTNVDGIEARLAGPVPPQHGLVEVHSRLRCNIISVNLRRSGMGTARRARLAGNTGCGTAARGSGQVCSVGSVIGEGAC
ncbi:MAG: hypothetical protein ACPIOQ_18995 [Promethearchaeia archaeon]